MSIALQRLQCTRACSTISDTFDMEAAPSLPAVVFFQAFHLVRALGTPHQNVMLLGARKVTTCPIGHTRMRKAYAANQTAALSAA